MILDAGADVSSLNHRRGNVLHATCSNEDCDLELIEFILKSYTRDQINQTLGARTMKWRLINFLALTCHRLRIGRSGSLLDRIARGVGQTALHSATARGNVDAVEALLKAGANPHSRTSLGEDVFSWERKHGPFPKIEELLNSFSGDA